MIFGKRKNNFFALSFSDQEIQLVQADRKGQAVINGAQKLEPGIIERGWLKKPIELTKVLETFLKSKKIKTRFVAVGLSEVVAFSRVLDLPNLPLEELDDAVRWQSEPLLPMPLGEANLDWMLLEKEAAVARVLVIALPAKLVEDYAQILQSLKFQPVAFEPTSLSLCRLIKKGQESSLIIETREKEAVLVIVGIHGGMELSSTVILKEEGGEEEFFSTITNLLFFYKKKIIKEAAVSKIFLCGQGASENLAAEIKKITQVETELVLIKPIELAATVSLAKKDIAAPIDQNSINLIPPRIQGIYDLVEKSRILSNWVKFWLFSLFLIFFSFGVSAARIYFDLSRIEGEIIQLQASSDPKTKEIEVKAAEVITKASKVLSFSDSQRKTFSLLETAQEATTEGVILDHYSIDFEKRLILINGVAALRDQLLLFRDNLEKTEEFAQIRIPLSILEKEENVDFTISLVGREKS